MPTKASIPRKDGSATATVKYEVKKKMTQKAIGLLVQKLSIESIIPN